MIEKFTSHLKVDKKIVELLSKQTYQKNFSAAVRELISNSYDADSLSVNISFDKSFSYIEIVDDGNGMTRAEFDRYLTIAGTKQDNSVSRKYKRKKIGQFGVGFLSIFPFCESLEITTTSENSTDVLKATIPTKDYFNNNLKLSVKSQNDTLVDNIPIAGTINTNPSQKLEHYTKIRLFKPTHIVKQYFSKVNTKKRESIIAYDPIERFKWELQEDLPIALPVKSKYFEKYKYPESIGINVTVNKKEIYRNDYLGSVLDEGDNIVAGIKCKYIFTSDYKSVKPSEARGVKLRVNNVGIGQRTDFFLKRDRGYSRLHWITGEVFFSEEIKEYLNISRDSFVSHPVTDEIFEFFADKLRKVANDIETIDVAEKEIDKVMTLKSSKANVSRQEVINTNIKKLESKGFKIVEGSKSKISGKSINVDRNTKTIYISKDLKNEKEYVSILGKKYEIIYEKWDIKEDFPACKKITNKIIAINQNYPLFNSKSAGSIFKRIHLIILIASVEAKTSTQLTKILNKEILKEFPDYT